jgi:hypothetical protein
MRSRAIKAEAMLALLNRHELIHQLVFIADQAGLLGRFQLMQGPFLLQVINVCLAFLPYKVHLFEKLFLVNLFFKNTIVKFDSVHIHIFIAQEAS